MVQNPTKQEKPKKIDTPDFLAQTSQEGGGNQEEKVRPKTAPDQPPSAQVATPTPPLPPMPVAKEQPAAKKTPAALTQKKSPKKQLIAKAKPKPTKMAFR